MWIINLDIAAYASCQLSNLPQSERYRINSYTISFKSYKIQS